jgi:hypothetical protein
LSRSRAHHAEAVARAFLERQHEVLADEHRPLLGLRRMRRIDHAHDEELVSP